MAELGLSPGPLDSQCFLSCTADLCRHYSEGGWTGPGLELLEIALGKRFLNRNTTTVEGIITADNCSEHPARLITYLKEKQI